MRGGKNDVGLWSGVREEAQVNVCGLADVAECVGERETGRYLVFSSFGQLVRSDSDDALDVYRYDTQTGMLERVSAGEEGYDADGNCEGGVREALPTETVCDARVGHFTQSNSGSLSSSVVGQRDMGDRAISEDGSRIVFTTAAPLSPAATNGLVNVYEWYKVSSLSDAKISLVSSGSSLTSDGAPVIDQSGDDIFFETSQGLVSQDTDGQTDIYDAYLGEGFPSVPAEPEPCSGDACQGPLTNPAPLLVPGSVSQAAGGNLPAPKIVKAKSKAKAKKAKPKKKVAKKRPKAKGSLTGTRR